MGRQLLSIASRCLRRAGCACNCPALLLGLHHMDYPASARCSGQQGYDTSASQLQPAAAANRCASHRHASGSRCSGQQGCITLACQLQPAAAASRRASHRPAGFSLLQRPAEVHHIGLPASACCSGQQGCIWPASFSLLQRSARLLMASQRSHAPSRRTLKAAVGLEPNGYAPYFITKDCIVHSCSSTCCCMQCSATKAHKFVVRAKECFVSKARGTQFVSMTVLLIAKLL